jgi:hypothetical protein
VSLLTFFWCSPCSAFVPHTRAMPRTTTTYHDTSKSNREQREQAFLLLARLAGSSLTTQGSAVRTRHRPPRKAPSQEEFYQSNERSEGPFACSAFRVCSASQLQTMLALFRPERSGHHLMNEIQSSGHGRRRRRDHRSRTDRLRVLCGLGLVPNGHGQPPATDFRRPPTASD